MKVFYRHVMRLWVLCSVLILLLFTIFYYREPIRAIKNIVQNRYYNACDLWLVQTPDGRYESLKNFVTIQLKGGLGNQLFQYAAALSLATKNQMRIAFHITGLDERADRPYQLNLFAIPQYIVRSAGRTKWYQRLQQFVWPVQPPIYKEKTFYYDPSFYQQDVRGGLILSGYFSTARYLIM